MTELARLGWTFCWLSFIAIGGGSTLDTAKAVNLYTTYPPDDFLDYVNPPIGKGLPVPGALKPLMAVPTTAGTGSETTGVAIFDLKRLHAKTGIANRRLKPTLGYLDPENTRTLPAAVAASAGLDILSHAVESYTAAPFTSRPRPARPALRPAYQGSNPISDIWAMEAMRLVARYLVRVVEDATDDEARAQMLLAASYAGVGFGNAGVHLPHGMSYAVSGNVRTFVPDGRSLSDPVRALPADFVDAPPHAALDARIGGAARLVVSQRQQRAYLARAQLPASNHGLHCNRKFEKTHQISDSRATLTCHLSDLLLRQPKFGA